MSAPPGGRLRVVVYGSCVSRDTFEHLDAGTCTLERYVARQSLISAYATPTPLVEEDLETLASAFQRRTVRDDFAGSLHQDLVGFGRRADLVLWDLTDERYGVWDLGGGQFVTRSVELVASGLDARLSTRGTLVPFGSRRHLALWGASLVRLTSSLQEAEVRRPPVLLAPRWATKDDRGDAVATTHGLAPREANRLLRRYVRLATGAHVVYDGGRRPTAGSAHRWGAAPYHYADVVYERLASEIRAYADSVPGSAGRAGQPGT